MNLAHVVVVKSIKNVALKTKFLTYTIYNRISIY
jgi:hypothetical protein